MAEKEGQPILKLPKKQREEFPFIRSELFHQMLMEDFEFLEAARWKTGSFEPPTFNYADVSSKCVQTLRMLTTRFFTYNYNHFYRSRNLQESDTSISQRFDRI